MADTKVTALTAATTASTDDLLYVVDDPGGTPTSKKITVDNFQKSLSVVGKVTLTQPATAATLTIANNQTLTVNGSATITNGTHSGTNTGDQTISLTGNVTGSGTGSFATTIAAGVVTNSMLANVNTATFKGRTTAGSGSPEDLTATQATALLNAVVGDAGAGGTKGLVPAPGAGDAAAGKFLKADGTWVAPSGSGDVVGPASATDNAIVRFDGTTGKLIQNSAATIADTTGDITAGKYNTVAISGSSTPTLAVTGTTSVSGSNTGDQNLFSTIAVSGQSNVVADAASDTLTLVAGTNITITTDASTDSITIAASGGAGGGTKTYAVFTPLDNQPPATNYATLDTRNSIAVLDFDTTTEESAIFVGIIPEAASLGSGLVVKIHWAATSATTGDCRWGAQFQRNNTDLDADSFDTATEGTSTTNGTSGIITVTSLTCTNIDSVAAGDSFRLKIYRDVGDAADTMAGDAELVAVEVRSAA